MSEPDTDSAVRDAWNNAIARNASDDELRLIKRRWNEILARKQAGELTDAARVEALIKTIREAATFLGVKITFDTEENEFNEAFVSNTWILTMEFAGDSIRAEKWVRFSERINVDIRQTTEAAYIDWRASEICTDGLFGENYDEVTDVEDDAIGENQTSEDESDNRLPFYTYWTVFVDIWDGPSEPAIRKR